MRERKKMREIEREMKERERESNKKKEEKELDPRSVFPTCRQKL